MAAYTRAGIPAYYIGLSTDTKPTSVEVGSRRYETDTGKEFITRDGTNWLQYAATSYSGDILPMTDDTYWLGSDTLGWKGVKFPDTKIYQKDANTIAIESIAGDRKYLNALIGRTATYVVAASDSPAHVKAQADAVCDGTADEVEINAAITAANGGSVSLSQGTFTTSAPISITIANTVLRGQGRLATKITTATQNFTLIDVTAFFVEIRDLWVDGANAGAGTNILFGTVETEYCTVDNCYLTSSGSGGAISMGYAGGYGGNAHITNNHISTNKGYGIYLTKQHDSFISKNRIEASELSGFYLTDCYSNNIIGNESSLSTTGYGIYDTLGRENQIIDNILDTNDLSGIYLTESHNEFVTDNRCTANEQHGILAYKARACTIKGNNCYRNSGEVDNTYDGIHLEQNTYGNIITDNICGWILTDAVTDAASKQRYGFYVRSGGTGNSSENIIRNNMLLGNMTAPVGTLTGVVFDSDNGMFTRNQDVFLDVRAALGTAIRSNEDLSEAVPNTFTIDAQPDVARSITWTFDSHAQITAFTLQIKGVTAEGYTITEEFTEGDGWSGETDNAFATISFVKLTARTGTGAGDTMDIGTGSKLGLSNNIAADPTLAPAIIKAIKNKADYPAASYTLDYTYNTIDVSTGGAIVNDDDFAIWYRSPLNLVD